MLLVVLGVCATTAVLLLGAAVAFRRSRGQRLAAIRAAAAYQELEDHLAKLGAGIGVGA